MFYIVVWTATDVCGNESQCEQTINVIDNTPPQILNVPANESAACGNIPAPPTGAVTATDNCDNNVNLVLTEETVPGACSNGFNLIRTWTATDACGNVSTATQTISVDDVEAPVLSQTPADQNVTLSLIHI